MISLILYPGALDIRQNLPFSLNLPTDTILSFSINTFQSQTVPFPLPHSLLFSLPNESPQSPLYLYSHLETKDFSSSTCTRISNGRGLWNEQYTFGGSFTTQFLKNGEIMLELFFDLTIIEHDITLSRKTRSPISNLLVPLIIGHRGLGMNRKLVDEKARLQLGENTYQSFETACDLGAEMVEFDIQMTSDGVPVIYHGIFTL